MHSCVVSLGSQSLRLTLWQMPFAQLVTNEDLKLAGERPTVPHVLTESLPDWPVSIVLPEDLPNYSCKGLRVLVLCSDLGKSFIEIPRWVLSKFVVIMLPNFAVQPEKRYGFARVAFVSGDSTSWQGLHDVSAVQQAVGFVVSHITDYHAEDYVVIV